MPELIAVPSIPRFPPELIDSLFSFLQVDEGVDHFDEGLATLERCSMDPVLCQFAEKHFITVRNSTVSTKGVQAYVFEATALAKLFCLEEILSRVSRLESVALSHLEKGVKGWASTPESFRAAFVACIKSTRMKKVVLEHHQHFPLSVLDDCGIRNLILQDVHLSLEPQMTRDDIENPSYSVLDSLTLNRVQVYPQFFEVWAKTRIHVLRSLTLAFSPWEFVAMSSMLTVLSPLCSNTLTSLHLDFLKTFMTLQPSRGHNKESHQGVYTILAFHHFSPPTAHDGCGHRSGPQKNKLLQLCALGELLGPPYNLSTPYDLASISHSSHSIFTHTVQVRL